MSNVIGLKRERTVSVSSSPWAFLALLVPLDFFFSSFSVSSIFSSFFLIVINNRKFLLFLGG